MSASSPSPRHAAPLLAILLTLCLALAARATGDGYAVRHWRVDDGLPDNTVNRIVQDDRGFLWLATTGGLARFDGWRFDEYRAPELSRDGSASIRDIALEPDGSLAMLPAAGGIFRYRNGTFSEHPASSAMRDRPLLQLFSASDGALWIVPSGTEVLRWQAGALQSFGTAEGFNRRRARVSFAVDERGRTWLAAADFLGYFENGALHRRPDELGQTIMIAPARNGGFWVATESRLFRMQKDVLASVPTGPGWSQASNGIQDLFEDNAGIVWIASRRHGISRLQHGTLESVPGVQEGALSLMQDTEGNLWAGTNGAGIARLRRRPFLQLDEADGLVDRIGSSVCEDATGSTWVADRRGGIVRIAGGHPEVFSPPGLHEEFFANVVYPAPDGSIWVGATQGVFRVTPPPAAHVDSVAPELRDVHVLFVTRAGDVWVGAGESTFGVFRAGAFHPLSAADGYAGRRVKAVAEDSQGHLVVATDDRQVYAFADGRLRPLISKDEMPGGLIASMLIDQDDLLWLATSHGLVLRRGGTLHLFTTAQGLPDDVISQILADDHGRLWFGGRRGIFSVSRAELLAIADGRTTRVDAVALGRDEGLADASALNNMQPMSWKGQSGRLWFTTFQGVVGIDPAASLPILAPPRVYIDDVQVNQRDVATTGPVHLGPDGRQVTFGFSAINYSAPERVRLRHRLVGYDFDWVETGRDHRAIYSRLPPGEYRLEATAANAGGDWSRRAAQLRVIVDPKWWQTWWARGAFVVLFTLGIGGAVRFWSLRRLRLRLQRLEHEHALEKERSRIARDLHDELGGSLTQIGMLADRVRRRAAESEVKSSLNQLSWRTRRLADELESIVWTVNPGNNTWDKLALFIDQYARGFCRDTALHCTVDGTESIPSLALAPEAQHNVLSVVKESLNNILKHAHATEVKLRMRVSETAFELIIADNGIGFDPDAPEHAERNGLKNMRSRMSELSGELKVRSVNGVGTEIVLRQPLTPATIRS